MMKRFLLTVSAIAAIALPAAAQNLPRVSPKASIMQAVGLTDVTINYNRPSVRGRVIWGELVPFDQVWRTGANEATTIQFSTDVEVGGNKLPAGLYSLHTIPGREEWTVIFNKKAEQWGSYQYNEADDALRLKVKPRAGEFKETMSFTIPVVATDSAEVVLGWEKLEVPFTVKTDTHALALANIRTALGETDWRTAYRAADYAFQNNLEPENAMKWVDRSIAMQETHQNLSLKARMLEKRGDRKQAIATAERAIKAGQAATPKADTTATEKLVAEWKAKK